MHITKLRQMIDDAKAVLSHPEVPHAATLTCKINKLKFDWCLSQTGHAYRNRVEG